jgi:hypothetical protein
MGEEMAESMSEEITKAMNGQKDLETDYANLVTLRGQLKGISNKHKLKQTKQDIQVTDASPPTSFLLLMLGCRTLRPN